MKVLLFGASGMIGQAALKELLTRDEVTELVSFGRGPLEETHAKLKHVQRKDLHDWSDAGELLSNVDAVLWCLGISAGGMSEEAYTKITYTLTIDAAKAIVAIARRRASSSSPERRRTRQRRAAPCGHA
jgi:putative NADH-flavin reductase